MLKCKQSNIINIDDLNINRFDLKINDKINPNESCSKNRDKHNLKESSSISVGALKFEELSSKNAEKLKLLSQKCPYLLACYSAGQLLMWKDFYNASFATISGCVVIKLTINKQEQFLFPFAYEENADINEALTKVEKYASKNYIPYSFFAVPRSEISSVVARYTNVSFSVNRNASDYIYLSTDMQNFIGKKYSGQRNHINKFKKLYPDAVFRELNDQDNDKKKLQKFWGKYENDFNKTMPLAKLELEYSKEVFSSLKSGTDYMACIELDDEIISVCYGEKCGDVLIIHIEKSLNDFDGVYQFMVNNFAKNYGDDCKYINREDDAGNRGLRISKIQYKPLKIEEKISAQINSELTMLKELPKISTDNLTIEIIEEKETELYNKLCLDDNHNKYWGYDYHEHMEGQPPYDYFYKGAKTDFENRVSLTMAIRYNGNFIGEAVICEFDFRGNANLGIRILPEYTGKGFGNEAFSALVSYAIYELGLSGVTAYCYKQNTPSFNMLSSCMVLVKEDDKYYYFKQTT